MKSTTSRSADAMWEVCPEKRDQFQASLLAWYKSGRRQFSWRDGRRNAYQTLIVEMMLRKTDAGKVALVYDSFISTYPTPSALAEADEEVLRTHIRLLGIADRARLLIATAQKLRDDFAGRVPADLGTLMQLPGVGRYTASAVLCFAYRRNVPLLDTNIIRILDRVFSVRSERPRARDDRDLWEFAGTLVPPGRAVSYNRALLDFAATICVASRPKCEHCPLLPICDYGRLQSTPGSDAG